MRYEMDTQEGRRRNQLAVEESNRFAKRGYDGLEKGWM
jgi:hypothetical protein